MVEGLPPSISKTNNENWVIDWFDVNVGSIHPLQFIVDNDPEEQFVKKIYFYISKRMYKNLTKKDLVSVSKISDSDLFSFDYSETMVRFKTVKMMQAAGIKGKWDKTSKYFIKPKLYSTRRDVYSLGKNIYEEMPKNINILYDSYEKILSMPHKEDEYFNFIKKQYGITR